MKMYQYITKIPVAIYHRCRKYYYRFLQTCWPDAWDAVRYRLVVGHRLHWHHPQDLSEKLLWMNRHWQPQLKADCADKYLLHTYLDSKGLGQYAVPILGVWNKAEDIDFNALPKAFVLKCNHGCGYIIIVKDKSRLDISAACKQLNAWLLRDYSKVANEKHYKKIKPRIIAEELLTFSSNSLIDYKIHCINGEPYCVLLCADRENGHADLYSYSTEWNRLDYLLTDKERWDKKFPRPATLEKMLHVAKQISTDFPYVRVDCYDIDGRLYVGELTFTPYGNIMSYYRQEVLEDMGKRLHLPASSKN